LVSDPPERPSFDQLLDMVVEDFRNARIGGRQSVDTGYPLLNEALGGGWHGTDNIALVGRIGDGKTYIALKHALAAWLSGKRVLFLSMDIGAVEVAPRRVGMHCRLNPQA